MNRTLLNERNSCAAISFAERPGVEFHISEREIGRGSSCIVYHAVCSDHTEHLLKEYYPKYLELRRDDKGRIVVPEDKQTAFEQGLVRFQSACERQKAIRLSNASLKNFTCNVQGYYKANGTEYIDMTCFNGQTYDHIQEKSVYDLMLRMRTLTQVVGNYHKAGLLHLDIKPENIYVRPENETVEDVMLFDFDSVTPMDELITAKALSCTKTWAAPEQLLPGKRKILCPATDLFAIGEIIFVQLFGRHSTNSERRSFVSAYPYDYNAAIFKDMNPRVFSLLDDLLCHTICGVVGKRYQSADELIAKLDEIIKIADPKKPYLKSSMPAIQDFFVGRDEEIDEIHRKLSENRILFLSGIGGIGKSELAKHYAETYRHEYDAIIFAPYVSDINMLIQDDTAVPLHNFTQYPEEKPEEYCARKLRKLQELCDERTLLIVDNLDREDDPDLNKLFDVGCKLLITTRMDFSDYGYGQQLALDALGSREKVNEIFAHYYTKPLSDADKNCVEQIIDIVGGHTITVELLAKQMMAGRVTPEKMLAKLREGGISESGKEKVRMGKDGKLSAKSAYDHIKALFDLSDLNEDEKYVLANLSLIPYTGIPAELFHDWCELKDYDTLNSLAAQGWVRWVRERDYVALHPIVADIMRDTISTKDVEVLISRFAEQLTDDNTGEVILQDISFNYANTLAITILGLFQSKQLEPNEEAIHCVGKIGDFFFEQSLFDLAEQSFCTQQELYKRLNLSDAYLSIVISNSLALLYDKQGELYGKKESSEKALCYLKECLAIVENPQNNMAEYIGTIYGNIGSIYHTLKDYENAENYYKRALEHSDRYSFCTNIGVLYENQGNYLKALEMHQEAMKRAIKHNEPELVIALIEHNMAVCYKRLGSLDDAVIHCKNALQIKEKLLDSGTSYDLALSKSLLGQIYVELGDADLIQEAERLLCGALISLEKIVGSEHTEYVKALDILNSFSKKD